MKKRGHRFYKLISIFTVALVLIVFLCSKGPATWASDKTNPYVKKVLSPLIFLHEFKSKSDVSHPSDTLKPSFKDLQAITTSLEEPEVIIEKTVPKEILAEDGITEKLLVKKRVRKKKKKNLLVPGKISFLLAGDSLVKAANFRFTDIAKQDEDLIFRVEGVVSANLLALSHFDWIKRSAQIAQEEDWDIVMIMLGANSPQAVIADGQYYEFYSQGWIELYKKRATEMINNYKNDGAEVWWIGLPPMGYKDPYNSNILLVDKIIDEICEETGSKHISIDEVFCDENGNYTQYKVVDGKQVKLRLDGIHYSVGGAELLSEYILAKLRNNFAFQSLDLKEAIRLRDEQKQVRFDLLY